MVRVRGTAVAPAALDPKVAVTPTGSPVRLRATGLAKPFCVVIAIVAVAVDEGCAVTLATDAASVNDGAVEVPVRSLMRRWPAGDPQPVVRS